MNIFILSTDPTEAARMHCDQHIHKMILESAQMLSTAAHSMLFTDILDQIYAPAYPNHPCTLWTGKSVDNMYWLCELALELNNIRKRRPQVVDHKSAGIVSIIQEYIHNNYLSSLSCITSPFVAAMPAYIKIRPSLSIEQKYQKYYRLKHRQWLEINRPMTFTYNPIPDFMKDLY